MGLHWPGHSWGFSPDFYLLLFWYGFIVRFYGVNLLRRVVELDDIGALVASGVGLLVLVWIMCGALLGVFLKYFTLL